MHFDKVLQTEVTTELGPVEIERCLKNARTLVLMAACAYIPVNGTRTTRQGFLSLEKAVREYRAAVALDEHSRARKIT